MHDCNHNMIALTTYFQVQSRFKPLMNLNQTQSPVLLGSGLGS